MKKKVFVAAAIVVCIAILAAGTLAYFTDDVVAHNVITSNEIDISIVEAVEEGSTPIYNKDGELTGYNIPGAMPKTSVKKEVKVHNDANEPAWIRVQLSHVITSKAGEEMLKTINGVELVQYPIPEEYKDNWILKDGWYYYTKPVSGDAYTSLLIKEVKFAPEMDNPYQECTVELSVDAQAVQVKNNMPESGSVLDVAGWPEAPAN